MLVLVEMLLEMKFESETNTNPAPLPSFDLD